MGVAMAKKKKKELIHEKDLELGDSDCFSPKRLLLSPVLL